MPSHRFHVLRPLVNQCDVTPRLGQQAADDTADRPCADDSDSHDESLRLDDGSVALLCYRACSGWQRRGRTRQMRGDEDCSYIWRCEMDYQVRTNETGRGGP